MNLNINLLAFNKDNFFIRFYRLASVNILANIFITFSALISAAFLGHLQDISHLAGVAVSAVLFSYLYRLLSFLRWGTTGLTAQAVGRNNQTEILLVGLRNGLLALVIGVIIVSLQFPINKLWFGLLGVSSNVSSAGQAYFAARIWGAPAVAINLVITGWLLGKEKSGGVFLINIIANITNIILDYIFIIQWDWASTGAGLSSCLCQYIMLFTGLIFVVKEIEVENIGQIKQHFWEWVAFKRILILNRDILIRTAMTRAIFVFFTVLSSTFGTTILTGNTLSLEIVLVAVAVVEGIGFATETLAGQFKGQGEDERLRPLVITSLVNSLVIGISFALLSILFPQTILQLFTNHTEVIDEISFYLLWLLPAMGFISVCFMIDGYFFSLGDGKTPRNAVLISVLFGFIPLYLWAWYSRSNHILWLSFTTYLALRATITLLQLPKTLPVKDVVS